MNGKDFNGLIDKMGTLLANRSEGAIEFGENEFVNKLTCDCNHVGL
jgi:hypothetical protein